MLPLYTLYLNISNRGKNMPLVELLPNSLVKKNNVSMAEGFYSCFRTLSLLHFP